MRYGALAGLVNGALTAKVHIVAIITTLGRHACAVGGDKEATRLSGVPVDFYHIMTFVIGGTSVSGGEGSIIGILVGVDSHSRSRQ